MTVMMSTWKDAIQAVPKQDAGTGDRDVARPSPRGAGAPRHRCLASIPRSPVLFSGECHATRAAFAFCCKRGPLSPPGAGAVPWAARTPCPRARHAGRARRLAPSSRRRTEHALHQHVRSRGARGDADALAPGDPRGIDLVGTVDQPGGGALAFGELAQAVGIGAVRRTDHQHQRRSPRRPARAPRPGGSGWRSRCRRCFGPCMCGNRAFNAAMMSRVSSTRQRGLGGEGQVVGLADVERRDVVDVLDQVDRARAAFDDSTGPSCLRLPDARHGRSAPCRGRCGIAARLRGAPWSPADRWRRTPSVRARSASRRTACDTPCALKITVLPSGTSSSSSTKIAPRAAGRRPRTGCARLRGARRSARPASRWRA